MLEKKIFNYRVYGLNVASEFEIKELQHSDETTDIDVLIKFADLSFLHPISTLDYVFSYERQIITIPAVGAFVIEGDDTILVEPRDGVTVDLLAVPILGVIFAILLQLRGRFSLHGSAVIHNGYAYGFVGDRGAGKSTLAAMLLKNSGTQFLTDDVLVLSDDLRAFRGYRQLKLSNEALENSVRHLGRVRPPPMQSFPKNQFLLEQETTVDSVPLGGVFELRRATRGKVEDLNASQAISMLLRFSYMGRFPEREMSQTEKQKLFQTTAHLAGSGKVKRIYVPEHIDELHNVINLL